MIVSLIVAVDEKSGIGKNKRLPWHIPSDLSRFKKLTMGHHLVVGRKTYETIGRSLPGRIMLVLTHQENYSAPGCIIVNSLVDALKIAEDQYDDEVFVIGGGEVFQQTIALADRIYLTKVHTDTHADVRFPEIDITQWKVDQRKVSIQDSRDEYSSDFVILMRRNEITTSNTKSVKTKGLTK